MSNNRNGDPILPIRILDKTYEVRCHPQKRALLQDSAQHLDKVMRDIKNRGKLLGHERIAIMAALNICSELLELSANHEQQIQTLREQIHRLHQKIEETLSQQEQLPL